MPNQQHQCTKKVQVQMCISKSPNNQNTANPDIQKVMQKHQSVSWLSYISISLLCNIFTSEISAI